MGISHLFVLGDSLLAAGPAEGVELSPLMKAYAGEVRNLECCFHSLKLEHVPRRQDVPVKELSQISTKGLPVPVGVMVERLFQPSAVPKDEVLGSSIEPERGTLSAEEQHVGTASPASKQCTLPV
jgi:hypothetical protein